MGACFAKEAEHKHNNEFENGHASESITDNMLVDIESTNDISWIKSYKLNHSFYGEMTPAMDQILGYISSYKYVLFDIFH